MARTRYAEIRTMRGIISGYVPAGLEYFTSSHNGRPVEYAVYRDEFPETVTVTYLDVGTKEAVQIGEVLLAELQAKAVSA